MKKKQTEPVKSFSLRIPVTLLEELHLVAQQHNRSLNGEVLTVLQAHVTASKKKPKKE